MKLPHGILQNLPALLRGEALEGFGNLIDQFILLPWERGQQTCQPENLLRWFTQSLGHGLTNVRPGIPIPTQNITKTSCG